MKQTLRSAVLSAVGVLLFRGMVHAISFTGSATGTWTNVVSVDLADVHSIANNDAGGVATFNWGRPATTSFDNQFTFNGSGSDGGSWATNSEDPFLIGAFLYRNGSTFNSAGVNGVDLSIALAITSPLNVTDFYNFNFSITNTPNNTGNPVLDGDIVTVAGAFSPTTFNYLGTTYTLQLLGFSNDGGATVRTDFSSPEGAMANAGVYGRITSEIPNSVPEPGTLLLLGLGLSGMAAFARKRRT